MERQIYAVSEINQFIKHILDNTAPLSELCVRGELSNYKMYPSGHHYFTLKDTEGALRCVMFRGQAARLRFRPGNGMKVLAVGRITVFPRDGIYQLYCDALMPDGVGELHVALAQLKDKLWQEGLFDEAHKKPLPEYPSTIAVVTSPAGAAVHDILRILRRRYPLARVKLLPVRVQGAEAPGEIVEAIRYANQYHIADVMIVGRGGGSMEDLWAFNDEQVAHAIYESDIPIISAVGHEPDVTISDFVADVRAATPSHAAEIAVPDRNELLEKLQGQRIQLLRAQTAQLRSLRRRLDALSAKRVLTDPMAVVQDKEALLAHLQKELFHAGASCLNTPQRRLASLAASLDALSPLKVLGRGFSMLTDQNGDVIRSSEDTAVGETLTATLASGQLLCTVRECRNNNEKEKEKRHGCQKKIL